jgi:N-acetylmuramoyl-L-alanine amidase
MRRIRKIIIHCSANSNPNLTVMDVRADHVTNNHWHDVGYHYFIRTDGTIETGRPIEQPGAHVFGQNANSVGICVNGLKLEDFNEEQFKALEKLLHQLKFMGGDSGIHKATLHPHNEFNKGKTCPVFDIERFKKYWESI